MVEYITDPSFPSPHNTRSPPFAHSRPFFRRNHNHRAVEITTAVPGDWYQLACTTDTANIPHSIHRAWLGRSKSWEIWCKVRVHLGRQMAHFWIKITNHRRRHRYSDDNDTDRPPLMLRNRDSDDNDTDGLRHSSNTQATYCYRLVQTPLPPLRTKVRHFSRRKQDYNVWTQGRARRATYCFWLAQIFPSPLRTKVHHFPKKKLTCPFKLKKQPPPPPPLHVVICRYVERPAQTDVQHRESLQALPGHGVVAASSMGM